MRAAAGEEEDDTPVTVRRLLRMVSRIDGFCKGPADCEKSEDKEEPCDGCLKARLMDLINTTPAGKVVQSTIELSSLLAQRVTITFDDFTAREAKALQILAEERESARKDRAFFDGEGSATPGSARIGSIPLEDL